MTGSKYIDTTVDTAMAHGWTNSLRTRYAGLPFFMEMQGGECIPFDPWWLKKNGFIKSTTMLIYGPLDHGKSAFIKMLAFRLAMLVWGFSLFRLVINDRKPEGTEGEYGALSRLFDCTPYSMRDMQINPFERSLFLAKPDSREPYELGLLDLAQVLCEYEFGPQTPIERYALRVALYDMLHADDEAAWSPERLQRISGSLLPEMKDGYHKHLDARLVAQTAEQLERVTDVEVKQRIIARTTELVSVEPNIPFEVLRDAGVANAARLGSLLHGPLGSMFGVKHSLYGMLTQRLVDKDWRGMLPNAETLMHILETRIKTIATDMHRVDLLPHMDISDELHKSMDNLMFAEMKSYEREVARSMPTLQVDGTHAPNSILKGGKDSPLYNIGEKIIDNTALTFYGRMPNKKSLLDEIQDRETLTNAQRKELPHFQQYVFGAKFGKNEPWMQLHPLATDLDQLFIGSNQAVEDIMNRPSTLSPDDMRRFAEKNGLTYVGP